MVFQVGSFPRVIGGNGNELESKDKQLNEAPHGRCEWTRRGRRRYRWHDARTGADPGPVRYFCEEHPVLSEVDSPRLGDRAAADEPGIGDGVMRRAEGAAVTKPLVVGAGRRWRGSWRTPAS